MPDDPCRFYWLVRHPTLTLRGLEATFFSEYPILTQWRVNLSRAFRIDDRYVEFSLSLACVGIEEKCIISAQNLLIQITRGDALVVEEKRLPYDFSKENGHSYRFRTDFYDQFENELSLLLITIELTFHQRFGWRRTRSEFVWHLNKLSKDLSGFLNNQTHSNLILKPKDSKTIFHVHSYIIKARWNNFFEKPSLYTVRGNTIKIDISPEILEKILTYMYYGVITLPENNRSGQVRMTELFQVIDFYGIHHLYWVFAMQDSGQVRETLPNMIKSEYYLTLNNAQSTKRYLILIPSHGDGAFGLRLTFPYPEDVYSVSYTLESHSPRPVFGRVNLGYVVGGVVRPFHERDYTIGPCQTVRSGALYANRNLRQMNVIYLLVRLADGSTVMQVRNSRVPGVLPLSKRYEVLSDHMKELLNNRTDSDSRVICRSRNPGHSDVTHPTHRGILEARVPAWRRAIQDVSGGADGDMQSFIKSEAFEPILDYIYSGIGPNIPPYLYSEMYIFAMSTCFWALVYRLRMMYQQY